MASNGTAELTLPSEDQILITREFDAPRELVFEAYTRADLIERWWAGRRGKVTSIEIDLRVGGTYRYVMETSEGQELAFHGEFKEVVPNERIVSTEVFEAMGGEGVLATVTFAEAGKRSTLSMLIDAGSREGRDAMVASGMEGGIQEGMDLLEELAISLGENR